MSESYMEQVEIERTGCKELERTKRRKQAESRGRYISVHAAMEEYLRLEEY